VEDVVSVVRIDNQAKHTHGWQARAHVAKGMPRLTKLVSDSDAGGRREALKKARWHEARLKAQANRIRSRLP
jgi:hypothetical protein